jgi:hypothetical protein
MVALNVKTYVLIDNGEGQYTKAVALETGGIPGKGGPGKDSERKSFKARIVPLDRLDEVPGVELAVQPRPLRMAIIEASFPYKAQLMEFQRKLHLRSINAVLDETVKTRDDKEIDAFRFEGVLVQRRELDRAGNPSPWRTVHLARAYEPWLVLSGEELEEDNPMVVPIRFDGLVMGRLPEFRPDELRPPAGKPFFPGGRGGANPRRARASSQYPEVWQEVPNLARAAAELARERPQQIAVPRGRVRRSKLDVFRLYQPPEDDKPTTPKPQPKRTERPGEAFVPDHCLVRVIDITIEPGKTYEYRLQVRMGNPNYGRKDVASADYAQGEMLSTDDRKWLVIPNKLSVPSDMLFYALDQKDFKESDGKPYRGINANRLVHSYEVPLQIHR